MTRHGLEMPHPAITTMLEARTFTSAANFNRTQCHGAPKTALKNMAPTPKKGLADLVRTTATQRSTDNEHAPESEIPIAIA